ncbi:MAG: hypothetical protein ACI898_001433 [Flavobacteriales bacterium]
MLLKLILVAFCESFVSENRNSYSVVPCKSLKAHETKSENFT